MYFISVCSRHDRYDSLRMCIGEELHSKLANLRLFMVSNLFCFFHKLIVLGAGKCIFLFTQARKKYRVLLKSKLERIEIGWSVSC